MNVNYLVHFDRIGRNHNVPDLKVRVIYEEGGGDQDWQAANKLAEAVSKVARKNLISRWFEVTVFLEQERGLIEDGRFGCFSFTVIP
jgi:malate/lactate dehydrogenase